MTCENARDWSAFLGQKQYYARDFKRRELRSSPLIARRPIIINIIIIIIIIIIGQRCAQWRSVRIFHVLACFSYFAFLLEFVRKLSCLFPMPYRHQIWQVRSSSKRRDWIYLWHKSVKVFARGGVYRQKSLNILDDSRVLTTGGWTDGERMDVFQKCGFL